MQRHSNASANRSPRGNRNGNGRATHDPRRANGNNDGRAAHNPIGYARHITNGYAFG